MPAFAVPPPGARDPATNLPAPDDRRHCSSCDAVCCRLTVLLQEGDDIPGHLTARTAHGQSVMARDPEGWCVALDGARMSCSIYSTRPAI